VPGRHEPAQDSGAHDDAYEKLGGQRRLFPFAEQLPQPPGKSKEQRQLDEKNKYILLVKIMHRLKRFI